MNFKPLLFHMSQIKELKKKMSSYGLDTLYTRLSM